MKRFSLSRYAAVLALAALAACDAPAPTAVQPADTFLRDNSLAVTVANNNWDPLVSWDAALGASNYTVNLITHSNFQPSWSQIPYYEGSTSTFLDTVTGTSLLDQSRPFTGMLSCSYQETDHNGPGTRKYWYEYEVVALVPDGVVISRGGGPVGPCGF